METQTSVTTRPIEQALVVSRVANFIHLTRQEGTTGASIIDLAQTNPGIVIDALCAVYHDPSIIGPEKRPYSMEEIKKVFPSTIIALDDRSITGLLQDEFPILLETLVQRRQDIDQLSQPTTDKKEGCKLSEVLIRQLLEDGTSRDYDRVDRAQTIFLMLSSLQDSDRLSFSTIQERNAFREIGQTILKTKRSLLVPADVSTDEYTYGEKDLQGTVAQLDLLMQLTGKLTCSTELGKSCHRDFADLLQRAICRYPGNERLTKLSRIYITNSVMSKFVVQPGASEPSMSEVYDEDRW